MTSSVFSGTLNPTQSTHHDHLQLENGFGECANVSCNITNVTVVSSLHS